MINLPGPCANAPIDVLGGLRLTPDDWPALARAASTSESPKPPIARRPACRNSRRRSGP